MRIALLTPEFVTERYYSGGLAQYIYRLAIALVARGHAVHVLTHSDETPSEFEYKGIWVSRINSHETVATCLNRLSLHRLRSTTRLLALSYAFYQTLRRLHRRHPFDVAQYSNYNACGLIASMLLRIPFVLRISTYAPAWHEQQGVVRTIDKRVVELLERIQIRLSRIVYAPSYTLKRLLEEKAGVHNVMVVRTPYFMETEAWDSSVYEARLRGKKYVLFFGRLQLHKGIHILAQALPRFFAVHPDSYAAIVGLDVPTRLATSMQDYVRFCCAEYADRVIIMGPLPHAQLYPVIRGASLVVLPSLIDNLPNACLEAMALGKPVVGTREASFEEMIEDGQTGFLVPPGDVDALAQTLCDSWVHPRLDAIGRAAAHAMQAYAPYKTVEEFLALVRQVIGRSALNADSRVTQATGT